MAGGGSGSGGATGEGEAAGYGMGSGIGTGGAPAGVSTTTGFGDPSTGGQNSVALGGQVGPATGLSGYSVAGVNAPGPSAPSGYGNPGVGPAGGVSTAATVGGSSPTGSPTGGGASAGSGGGGGFGSQQGQSAQAQALANAALQLGVAPSALNQLWSAMNSSQVTPMFNQGMLGIANGMGTNALAGINRGATSPFGTPNAAQATTPPNQQQLFSMLQALNMNPMQMIGVPGMSMGFPAGNPSLGAGGIQGTPGIAGTLGPSHNFGSATGLGAPSMAAAPSGASPFGGPGAGISGQSQVAPSMLANMPSPQAQQIAALGMPNGASMSGGPGAGISGQSQAISPSVMAGLASLASGGYSLPQVTGSGRYS